MKALRDVMMANHQATPWVNDSEVEDSLLSLQIKSAGYLTKISAQARASVGGMTTHPVAGRSAGEVELRRDRLDVARSARRHEGSAVPSEPAGYGPFPTLFQALGIAWLGASVPGDLLPALALCAHQAAEAGLDWYAWEAVAVLRALGYPGGLPTLGEPPADLVLATRLLAPRAAWEIALEALQAVGAQTVPDAGGPGRGRTVTSPGRCPCAGSFATLEPRERRRTKGGVWTRGRPVALQRLAEDPDGLPYPTAQDRQICACILREQERTWYNGQERTLYRLDQDRALLAAAGHPRLVRAETHAAVELVRGAPTLAAERTKDILIRMEPLPPEGRTLLPVEEGPQRIRLVEFDARHRQISRILGPEGLRVPKGARSGWSRGSPPWRQCSPFTRTSPAPRAARSRCRRTPAPTCI